MRKSARFRPVPYTALRVTLAVVLFSLLAPAALAVGGSTLTFSNLFREVDAQATSFCPGCGPNGGDTSFSNGQTENTDQPGVFDEWANSLGSDAMQDSTVSATQLGGTGGIGLGGSGDNSARSTLEVTFQVSATGSYGIVGSFDILGSGIDQHFIEITSTGGQIFRQDGFGNFAFQDSFQLQSGIDYTLAAKVSGFDFSGVGSSAGWTFTLVPEPGSGLLLGVGLAALAARRRR